MARMLKVAVASLLLLGSGLPAMSWAAAAEPEGDVPSFPEEVADPKPVEETAGPQADSEPVPATEPAPLRLWKFNLGLGALAHNLGKYGSEPSGEGPFISSMFVELIYTGRYPLGFGTWFLSPLVSFTPIGHGSEEGSQSSRILRFAARAGHPAGPVDFVGGLGVLNWIVRGSGGTIVLDNGNTQTEFGLPSDSSVASYFYWEAGASVSSGRFRWESSLFVTGLLSSRRAFNFATHVTIGVF
jgi:hypothetical protein